jgi:phosphatidate cytidylyltransferase
MPFGGRPTAGRQREIVVSEWDEREPDQPRDPTEGVRIIGPDEVAEAERTDARRRHSDRPRYRDRPVEPPADEPRPSLCFPLDASADPDQIERPPVVPVDRHRPPTEVSHWAASAMEEVPNMSRRDPYEGDEAAAWSTFAGTGPRWRDDEPGERGEPLAFDEYTEPPPGRSVFGDSEPQGSSYEDAYADRGYEEPAYDEARGYPPGQGQGQGPPQGQGQPPAGGYDERYDDVYDDTYDDVYTEPRGSYVDATAAPAAAPRGARPRSSGQRARGQGGDRDMRLAVAVGVGLGIAALVLFMIGPVATMLLVLALLGLASYEYFTTTQKVGYDPLMPVGVTASVGAALAAYNYGESALPLVLVLSLAVCLVWYLVDAGGARPMANVGATMIGICWIGMFGAFAGLLLSGAGTPHGIALFAAALVPTIGYDIGALFVGKSAGSRPLSAASPNKTIEGLVGGMAVALVGGLLFGAFGPEPFDSISEGLKIGLVAALAAPLGDLAESLIKRDLGVKDMGTVLPGHGGVLDRFDALLFVLPAVWYLARVSDFFLT